MAKHQPKKLPRDVNARAFSIGELATSEAAPEPVTADEGKNPAAVQTDPIPNFATRT
jgi:hypothetical protein